jgi:pimeloyl-ACP methyl ester carboxylesterase
VVVEVGRVGEHGARDVYPPDPAAPIAQEAVQAPGRALVVEAHELAASPELIPGARFEVMEAESHQPFQEVPDDWNARVDAFWRDVDTGA